MDFDDVVPEQLTVASVFLKVLLLKGVLIISLVVDAHLPEVF